MRGFVSAVSAGALTNSILEIPEVLLSMGSVFSALVDSLVIDSAGAFNKHTLECN